MLGNLTESYAQQIYENKFNTLGFGNLGEEALTCAICNETCSPCGGGCTVTDLSYMYQDVTNFDATYGNISGWNTSCITNMEGVFIGSDFNQDISGWDTGAVTIMAELFEGAFAFNQPIGGWDTSQVTDMSYMFYGTPFNQPLDNWDTGSVTNMRGLFSDSAFNQDISGWDTGAVTIMAELFEGAFAFNQPIGSWDTSQVTDISYMFYDDLNVSMVFDQDLSAWNISQVAAASSMFDGYYFKNNLSIANYNALLNGWAAQPAQIGVIFDAGDSQYTLIGKAGRDILTDTYNWTITDGGLYTPPCTPNWNCSVFDDCIGGTKECLNVSDLNECGEEYTGDFSEFEPVFCSYNFTYQESADAWSAEIMGGTGFFLVNYTKPVGANLNSLWQLKHGDLATYNATIPLECWNADNITLMFRIESGHQGYSYQPCWSYPTCWNGTEWESLGVDSTTTDGFGGGCGSSAEFLMEDGNWSTNALFLNLWYGNDCSAGDGWKIYEEAMWWNMTEIPCEPLWNCSVFDDCIGGTKECLNVSDLNECGVPFEGLLSDFDEECEEETPTGYVAQFGTGDLPKLTIDVLGKGLLELIGLVGLVAVIVIAVGGASRLKKAVRK
jgi:surface protein